MRPTNGPDTSVDFACVTAGYGSRPAVLHDVDLWLPATGLTVVRGPNGSGKSTLVELASGYLTPRAGTVTIAGLPADRPEARAHRRVVRARPALFPAMTVHDHLALAAATTGTDREEVTARGHGYGLAPWFDADAGSLSTGNLRKLWVVMCTTGTFDVVLLDEPYSGLDPEAAELLTEELTGWALRRQVVVVTHGGVDGLPVDRTVTVVDGRIGHVAADTMEGAR